MQRRDSNHDAFFPVTDRCPEALLFEQANRTFQPSLIDHDMADWIDCRVAEATISTLLKLYWEKPSLHRLSLCFFVYVSLCVPMGVPPPPFLSLCPYVRHSHSLSLSLSLSSLQPLGRTTEPRHNFKQIIISNKMARARKNLFMDRPWKQNGPEHRR